MAEVVTHSWIWRAAIFALVGFAMIQTLRGGRRPYAIHHLRRPSLIQYRPWPLMVTIAGVFLIWVSFIAR